MVLFCVLIAVKKPGRKFISEIQPCDWSKYTNNFPSVFLAIGKCVLRKRHDAMSTKFNFHGVPSDANSRHQKWHTGRQKKSTTTWNRPRQGPTVIFVSHFLRSTHHIQTNNNQPTTTHNNTITEMMESRNEILHSLKSRQEYFDKSFCF